jgi:hypothetical protein
MPIDIAKLYGVQHAPVTGDTVFVTPKVATLFRWWRSHATDGLPLRREFDITDHPDIVRDVFLVEVLGEGEYQVKLRGEDANGLVGATSKGNILRSPNTLGGPGDAIAAYYDLIVAEKTCRRCTGNAERPGDLHWVEFESIDCPLSRDGHKVDFIIGVIDEISRPQGGTPA